MTLGFEHWLPVLVSALLSAYLLFRESRTRADAEAELSNLRERLEELRGIQAAVRFLESSFNQFNGRLVKVESKTALLERYHEEMLPRLLDTATELGAMKKSTHSIHPVPVGAPGVPPMDFDALTKELLSRNRNTLDAFGDADDDDLV